jgi:hypothetical protein
MLRLQIKSLEEVQSLKVKMKLKTVDNAGMHVPRSSKKKIPYTVQGSYRYPVLIDTT